MAGAYRPEELYDEGGVARKAAAADGIGLIEPESERECDVGMEMLVGTLGAARTADGTGVALQPGTASTCGPPALSSFAAKASAPLTLALGVKIDFEGRGGIGTGGAGVDGLAVGGGAEGDAKRPMPLREAARRLGDTSASAALAACTLGAVGAAE